MKTVRHEFDDFEQAVDKVMPIETLQEYMAKIGPPKGFKPLPFFLEDGQFITWFWKNSLYFAEQINFNGNNIGKIFISEEDGTVIGVQINIEFMQ